MDNNNNPSPWQALWNILVFFFATPVVLFPIALLLAVIAEVVIQPMLRPY